VFIVFGSKFTTPLFPSYIRLEAPTVGTGAAVVTVGCVAIGEDKTFPDYLPEYGNNTNNQHHSQYLRDDIDVRTDLVQVTEAYWRSYKRIGLITYANEQGAIVQMMVTDDVMTADPDKEFNVNHSIIKNYVRLTIGLEGRGRIDEAELMGAAREIKKEESLLKGI